MISGVNGDTGGTLAIGLRTHYERCNVTDAASVEPTVVGVEAAAGRARVAVCCAGIGDGCE